MQLALLLFHLNFQVLIVLILNPEPRVLVIASNKISPKTFSQSSHYLIKYRWLVRSHSLIHVSFHYSPLYLLSICERKKKIYRNKKWRFVQTFIHQDTIQKILARQKFIGKISGIWRGHLDHRTSWPRSDGDRQLTDCDQSWWGYPWSPAWKLHRHLTIEKKKWVNKLLQSPDSYAFYLHFW